MGSVVLENLDYAALNNLINNLAEFLKNVKINSTFDISNVLVVLITPLLTGFVTFLVNRNTKKFDYKNDYYKKIIDKRIDAYEKLEEFLSEIDIETDAYIHVVNGESIKFHYYTFCEKRMDFQEAANKSIKICRYNTWYSKKIENLVNLLNMDMVNCFYQTTRPIMFTNGIKVFSKENNLDNYYIVLQDREVISSEERPRDIVYQSELNTIHAGDLFQYVRMHDIVHCSLWFNEFYKVISEIRKSIITDMLELHEVEKFLKSKKDN